MSSRWPALWGGLAAVVSVGVEVVLLRQGAEARFVMTDVLVGLTLVLCGQVAWRLRPTSPAGPLMTGAAVAWAIGTAAIITSSSAWTFPFFAASGYHDVVLMALVLGYPAAVLGSRPARLAIMALLLLYGLGSLTRLFAFQPAAFSGCPCPDNPFAVIESDAFFEAAQDRTGQAIGLVVAAVAAGVAVQWLRASVPARRVAFLMPVATVVLGLLFLQDTWLRPHDRLLIGDPAAFYVLAGARAMIPLAFVAGLVALRLAQARVADLVVAVGAGAPRDQLERTLGAVVGDEGVEVWWRAEDGAGFERGAERTDEVLAEPGRVVTRLVTAEGTALAVRHDASLDDNPGLAEAVTAAVRLAVENERLEAEVRRRLDEVQASRSRLVAAADAERARLERDLHDGSQQRLVSLALALRLARRRVDPDDDPELADSLDQAAKELAEALEELRELARGIHPAVLTDGGLKAALPQLAARCPAPVELVLGIERRLEPTVESTVWFVVAECLTNVAKYADATECRVIVEDRGSELWVRVTDDGRGGADPAGGSGLRGLVDRVAAVGGRLQILSPPGQGTEVDVALPVAGCGSDG